MLTVGIPVLELASTFAPIIELTVGLVPPWRLASILISVLLEAKVSLVEVIILLEWWFAFAIVEVWHLFAQMVRLISVHFRSLITMVVKSLLSCWTSFLAFENLVHRVVCRVVRLRGLVEAFGTILSEVERTHFLGQVHFLRH